MKKTASIERLTLNAAAVLVISTATLAGASFPVSDGGKVALSNSTGVLVAVTQVPTPCISFSGNASCGSGTTPVSVSTLSGEFSNGTGSIKDIGTTFPILQFEQLPGGPNVSHAPVYFDLTSVPTNGSMNVGDCTSGAPFSNCTPAFSPFTFITDSSGKEVSIQFSVYKNGYTGSRATGFTPYIGIFSTQQSGTLIGSGGCSGLPVSIPNILNCVAAGGTIQATWNGTESPLPSATQFNGCTYTQGGWGTSPHGNNPGSILAKNFATDFPGGLTIGSAPFNTETFLTVSAITGFLPAGGPPSFLNSSVTNPPGPYVQTAGVFAGQVLALALNVGINGYGSVIVTGTGTPFDGQPVSAVLSAADITLGGGPLPAGFSSISALNSLIDSLNMKYDNCN